MKRIALILGVVLALAPWGVSAQTVTCNTFFSQTTCTSSDGWTARGSDFGTTSTWRVEPSYGPSYILPPVYGPTTLNCTTLFSQTTCTSY